MVAAIVNLSRQPALRAQLAAQGKKHVASRFSADRYLAELQTFYCSNVESKSKALAVEPPTRSAGEATKFAEHPSTSV
jgi:hypothetical protein